MKTHSDYEATVVWGKTTCLVYTSNIHHVSSLYQYLAAWVWL